MEMSKSMARILVVDDEPWQVQFVQEYLELLGYGTLTAMDGQIAVELADAQEPDLILLDIRMPGIDGYEVCRRVRKFSTVPIIMLSTLSRDSDILKGLKAGADDYVTKPFGLDELRTRIQVTLQHTWPSYMTGKSYTVST